MDQRSGQKRAGDYLYPPVEPFDRHQMDVGDGHLIYVEQVGNPVGLPVLVLHGGPGGGCSTAMRRYFDPAVFRVVLFDQRGCGRSRPHASVDANTTWHLVADIEKILAALGIERTILFGGSWGATLALIYAITHPDRVRHLVLRGTFMMTKAELDWFYRGGAGTFFPDLWARFLSPLTEDMRSDPVEGYHRLLFSGNMMTETHAARIWAGWENALASVHSEPVIGDAPWDYARAFSRLENHYFHNDGFLECDDWIMKNRSRIEDISADIVQGRLDMICPPISSYRLAQGWAKAQLSMIGQSGHALSEPRISEKLVQIMDRLRDEGRDD